MRLLTPTAVKRRETVGLFCLTGALVAMLTAVVGAFVSWEIAGTALALALTAFASGSGLLVSIPNLVSEELPSGA